MEFTRRWRLIFLIIRELAGKYTKALILGFVCGLILSVTIWRIYPAIQSRWLTRVERIGLVGEFTPTTLPLSIQEQISGGLTTIKTDGTLGPGLATSWTATDSGKTFLFTLRPDATWHTGKTVTPQDVNYNIRNVTFIPLDANTLQANLQAPYSPFPTVVSKPLFISGLTGWGPYRVGTITLNGEVVTYLKVLPMDDPSQISREYRFYKTEAAAITAYKLGEIDRIEDLSNASSLSSWRGTTVTEKVNYHRIVSVYFNVTVPFLSDKSIRQGLAFGAPVREGVERAYSPISKQSFTYTDRVKKYDYDKKTAQKLLSDVMSATDSASLTISTFSPYLSDAQPIADSWSSLGIPTQVKVVPAVPSDYQVLVSAQDVPPDPDQYPFWHSTQESTNITHYNNVKIDKLLEDGRQELDQTKRTDIYEDFQIRLVEDAPAAFLYYAPAYTIERK